MFRTVPLSIIRSFSLYTQQRYMSYRFADSLRTGSGRNFRPNSARKLYDIYHCCVYSEKPLMMDRGTVRNRKVLILLASCQQTCMTYTIAVYSEKLLMMDRGTVRNRNVLILLASCQQTCMTYTSVFQTVVRGPQVVLGFCPCGPLRLNISPKKDRKIKLT